MTEKNMPHFYWVEVVNTIVYIMNRNPIVAIHGMTLKESIIGKKPNLSHLKVSGCLSYVHVPDEWSSNLGPKAEKCMSIRYSLE